MRTRTKRKQQWLLPVAGLVLLLIISVFLLVRCAAPAPAEEMTETPVIEQETQVGEEVIEESEIVENTGENNDILESKENLL